MPTKKELLEELLEETEKLSNSVDNNSDASEQLRSELDVVRNEISDCCDRFESVTDDALDRFSDRLSDLRSEIEATLDSGAKKIGASIVIGNLIGGAIQSVLEERSKDPQWILARRTYQVLHLINDSHNSGEHYNYDAALRLLRVHGFEAEQASYVVDILLKSGALKEYENEDGTTFIMIDPESEVFQQLAEGYKNNTLTYLPVGVNPTIRREN